MQINALFQAIRRRVAPLLIVFVLAIGAAVVGWAATNTVYDATAVAVVIPGAEKSDQPGVSANPLDRVGYATTQLATLTTVVAASPTLQNDVKAQTGAELLSANNTAQERTSAPQPGIQIVVTTRATTPGAAVAGGDTAIKLMNQELSSLQSKIGVLRPDRARIVELVPAQATTSSSRSRLRAAGGLFLGVAGLGTVAVLGLDALHRRQRRRNPRSTADLRPRATYPEPPRPDVLP